jgi:succinoglycan biosynthesis protein ExoA
MTRHRSHQQLCIIKTFGEPQMGNLPFISVIMPVYNEKEYMDSSLGSVIAQDYPPELIEILVVDGMSNDGTREIVRFYQRKNPNMSLIDNPGKIVPIGMNTALRRCRGEIIIRVDGHCEVAPDYVRKCVQYLQGGDIDGVGGPMKTIGETPLSESIAVAMSSKFGVGGSAFRTITGKSMLVDSIPFPAYTNSIIQKAGFYDEELVRNQDDEYNYRLRSLGARLLLASDIQSTYYSRGSMKKLWKQYYQYGYWKVRVLQKHPLQMRPRQFIPPLFVSALILSMIMALLSLISFQILGLPLLSLMVFYLLTNLAASTYTAAKKGWQHLLLLPILFAILHLSYGLGFLTGLFKFWNRWGDRVGKVPAWDKAAAR